MATSKRGGLMSIVDNCPVYELTENICLLNDRECEYIGLLYGKTCDQLNAPLRKIIRLYNQKFGEK